MSISLRSHNLRYVIKVSLTLSIMCFIYCHMCDKKSYGVFSDAILLNNQVYQFKILKFIILEINVVYPTISENLLFALGFSVKKKQFPEFIRNSDYVIIIMIQILCRITCIIYIS